MAWQCGQAEAPSGNSAAHKLHLAVGMPYLPVAALVMRDRPASVLIYIKLYHSRRAIGWVRVVTQKSRNKRPAAL